MTHAVQLAVLLLLQAAPSASDTCPAPEAVRAAILPATIRVLRANREHIVLSASDTALRVELDGPSGAPILERTLATTASCAARAAAAATLVEAMELELHGGAPRVELPALAGVGPSVTGEAETPARARSKPLDVELGVAFLGGLSQSTVEPAAGLTFDIAPRWAGVRLRAALFAEGRRSLTIGSASASYQSTWLAIGPGYRLTWRRFSIGAGLSLTGALQELRGDGLTSVTSTSAFEAGASLDAAAGWSFGSWRAWAGLFALYWPANTKVAVAAIDQNRALPSWEGLLGAGLQFTAL